MIQSSSGITLVIAGHRDGRSRIINIRWAQAAIKLTSLGLRLSFLTWRENEMWSESGTALVPVLIGKSSDLHNDLALGPAFFKIRQRVLCLIERKYLVYHRTDFSRFEQLADFRELATVWMHEQE